MISHIKRELMNYHGLIELYQASFMIILVRLYNCDASIFISFCCKLLLSFLDAAIIGEIGLKTSCSKSALSSVFVGLVYTTFDIALCTKLLFLLAIHLHCHPVLDEVLPHFRCALLGPHQQWALYFSQMKVLQKKQTCQHSVLHFHLQQALLVHGIYQK